MKTQVDRSSIHPIGTRCSWHATESPPHRGTKKGIASGIGANSALVISCHTGIIQYVVLHVPPLLRSFSILIVKHHEQQDAEVRNSK
ncbi:hypothetical protein V6N12_055749 [Hibiscus sabdariffa]|uniref:Uncharacterized protein n=1 Tax=Hibiscus sabdariffa TaxID=183260 RepID=A0ABR2B2K0_9ROSI